MKTKKTIKILLVALTATALYQSSALAIDSNYINSFYRNPFTPQLPKRKKVKAKPSPIKKKTSIEDEIKKKSSPVKKRTPAKTAPKPIEILPQDPPLMEISGLIWNSDRPQAIINNQVVDVGDKIETIQIVAINKEGIDIDFQGRTITIEP